jgi:EpsD family peptidyl-prolyl cis-trans isomerase
MTPTHRRIAYSVLGTALLLGLTSLTACGKKDGKAATQVAAKVGSEEISVHQINQVLSRANTAGATPEAAQAMGREVLEKLIDQQLAVDQAMEAKLHRSPDVVAQLEAARRELLARAYLQHLAGALPKPTPAETKKYHAEHPALFSERRIFTVQEVVAPMAAGVAEQLRALAASSKSIEDASAWLNGQGIKFASGGATRAAEQIPLDLLPQVHALKDGQSAVFANPKSVTLLRLASSQAAPVDEASALPRIEQFLANQRAGEAVAANIKQLRANAAITYMGEFASAAPAGAPTATAAPAANATAKTAIEKGVAGLK